MSSSARSIQNYIAINLFDKNKLIDIINCKLKYKWVICLQPRMVILSAISKLRLLTITVKIHSEKMWGNLLILK